MTILERRGTRGLQGLKKDQLDYLDLVRDRQVKAYELVREEDAITKEKHNERNKTLGEVLGKKSRFEVGDWVLVYDDKSTISGGGEHVLKSPLEHNRGGKSFALIGKLAHCWTGPYKVLYVGPGKPQNEQEVGPKILLLDISKDEPGKGINKRVSVHRCKKCYNAYGKRDKSRFLPWGLSAYVLNKYSEFAPPFHLTEEDVEEELDRRRLNPYKLSRHRICRGISGKAAVQYYTHWTGLEKCTWEHEEELTTVEQYGDVVMQYWAKQPEQATGGNAMYRRYRVQVAKRAAAHKRGERHVPKGYKLCCDVRGRPGIATADIIGSYMYYKTIRAGWQFARVTQVVVDQETGRASHTIKLLDIGKQINVELDEDAISIDNQVQDPGTWCWHAHVTQKSVKKYMHALE